MLRRFTLLVAFTIVFAAETVSASTWRLATTPNFEVLTDLDEDDARQLASDLELFRHTLRQIAGRTDAGDDVPVRVYALRHRRQATQVLGDGDYAGLYRPGMHGGVAAIYHPRRARWNVDGRRYLLHEYAHHYLRSFPGFRFPTWYDEGFAEFVSTFEYEEGISRLGAPPPDRLYVLDQFEWIGTEQLLLDGMRYLSDRVDVHPRRRRGSAPPPTSDLQMQYALGWFLTHYLYSDTERLTALRDYMARLNGGEAPAEAFPAAFGMDFDALDEALRDYWKGGRVVTFGFRFEPPDPPIEPEVRSFPDVDEKFWIAEARLRLSHHGKVEAMREVFAEVAEGSNDPALAARATLNLAELENDLGHFDAAARLGRAVYEPSRADLRAFGEIGRAALGSARVSMADGLPEPMARADRELAELEQALEQIFERGADDVHLRALHVQAHIDDQRANAEAGLRSLAALQRRYPQHPSIGRWAAMLYAEAGRHDRALEAIEYERYWARSPEQEAEFAALEEAVRAHAARYGARYGPAEEPGPGD